MADISPELFCGLVGRVHPRNDSLDEPFPPTPWAVDAGVGIGRWGCEWKDPDPREMIRVAAVRFASPADALSDLSTKSGVPSTPGAIYRYQSTQTAEDGTRVDSTVYGKVVSKTEVIEAVSTDLVEVTEAHSGAMLTAALDASTIGATPSPTVADISQELFCALVQQVHPRTDVIDASPPAPYGVESSDAGTRWRCRWEDPNPAEMIVVTATRFASAADALADLASKGVAAPTLGTTYTYKTRLDADNGEVVFATAFSKVQGQTEVAETVSTDLVDVTKPNAESMLNAALSAATTGTVTQRTP